MNETTIIDRRKVFIFLRQAFRDSETAKLAGSRHQGKTFRCFSKSKASSHFHREGDFTRFAEWRFIHRARLADVPLNAYRHSGDERDRRCRKCHNHAETLPHVLNHCRPFLPAITRRHNSIVERVKKAAAGRWKVLSENRPVGTQGLRPDLMLEKDNVVLLIDVRCPFENGESAFEDARFEKERKYAQLVTELRQKYRATRVEAIVVGSLGAWDPKNDRVVGRLCAKKYLQRMC